MAWLDDTRIGKIKQRKLVIKMVSNHRQVDRPPFGRVIGFIFARVVKQELSIPDMQKRPTHSAIQVATDKKK